MAYDYNPGDGPSVLDPTKPDGSIEPLSNLDDAIRQIIGYLTDATGEGLAKKLADLVTLEGQVGNLSNRAVFLAYTSLNQALNTGSPAAIVQFDQKGDDPDDVFDIATYKFTAPEDGVYYFSAALRIDSTGASTPTDIGTFIKLVVNATDEAIAERGMGDSLPGTTIDVNRMFFLNQGDEVQVRYEITCGSGSQNSQVTADSRKTIFQGFRIK